MFVSITILLIMVHALKSRDKYSGYITWPDVYDDCDSDTDEVWGEHCDKNTGEYVANYVNHF